MELHVPSCLLKFRSQTRNWMGAYHMVGTLHALNLVSTFRCYQPIKLAILMLPNLTPSTPEIRTMPRTPLAENILSIWKMTVMGGDAAQPKSPELPSSFITSFHFSASKGKSHFVNISVIAGSQLNTAKCLVWVNITEL